MATGRSIQLHKQIGEYLVACELARRGLLVATFSGNVPDFDIVAGDENGHSIPIQVKTIRGGSWQFSADKFVEIKFEGKKQRLGMKVVPRIPHLICVFVLATEYGKDRFYILEWEQIRDIVISQYTVWLDAHEGMRPKNYKSLHCSVRPEQLVRFENKWKTILKRLSGGIAMGGDS